MTSVRFGSLTFDNDKSCIAPDIQFPLDEYRNYTIGSSQEADFFLPNIPPYVARETSFLIIVEPDYVLLENLSQTCKVLVGGKHSLMYGRRINLPGRGTTVAFSPYLLHYAVTQSPSQKIRSGLRKMSSQYDMCSQCEEWAPEGHVLFLAECKHLICSSCYKNSPICHVCSSFMSDFVTRRNVATGEMVLSPVRFLDRVKLCEACQDSKCLAPSDEYWRCLTCKKVLCAVCSLATEHSTHEFSWPSVSNVAKWSVEIFTATASIRKWHLKIQETLENIQSMTETFDEYKRALKEKIETIKKHKSSRLFPAGRKPKKSTDDQLSQKFSGFESDVADDVSNLIVLGDISRPVKA